MSSTGNTAIECRSLSPEFNPSVYLPVLLHGRLRSFLHEEVSAYLVLPRAASESSREDHELSLCLLGNNGLGEKGSPLGLSAEETVEPRLPSLQRRYKALAGGPQLRVPGKDSASFWQGQQKQGQRAPAKEGGWRHKGVCGLQEMLATGLQMKQARGQDIPLYLISLPRTEKDVCSKASVPSLQSLTAFVSAEHTILLVGCLPSLQTLHATCKRCIKSRHQTGIKVGW